ncbi:hypothetical protein EYF80_062058 [Liparis tanakae]|uniref:Uncharacterized protein n=1 Tax=Liparis tanakae TaxID=230148 RepID=A0A4Z2EGE3_9TELE|nr:hypothetical protein EYF80_062058 [Liparis tanakae]
MLDFYLEYFHREKLKIVQNGRWALAHRLSDGDGESPEPAEQRRDSRSPADFVAGGGRGEELRPSKSSQPIITPPPLTPSSPQHRMGLNRE